MTVMHQLQSKKLEISIPEEVSLRLKPRLLEASEKQDDDDEASITSEISLDFLAKERETESALGGHDSSDCWNPDGSDYTLDVLLSSKDDDDRSVADSTKDSLMTSDYSLNIKLSKSQHSLKSSMPCSRLTSDHLQNLKLSKSQHSIKTCMSGGLGASQHSLDSHATFASSRTNKSSEFDLASDQHDEPADKESPKKVSFHPRIRVHRVPNRSSMLRATRSRVWYDREDFKTIRQECFETIRAMQDGHVIDEDDGLCSLGLEYKMEGNYKKRQRNKREVRQVVFDEQEFQRENERMEPAWIARVSIEHSKSCIEVAIATAKKVEEDIKTFIGTPSRWDGE